MYNDKSVLISFYFVSLFTVPPVNAVPDEMIVFVSADGEDASGCGSRTNPCQTLRSAITMVLL